MGKQGIVMSDVVGYIVVEQVIGESTLSTYNLNLRYQNHLNTFNEFGFTEQDVACANESGCVTKVKESKNGSCISYTLIKKV